MEAITVSNLIEKVRPGDIGLTKNPQGLGVMINFAQGLEGDKSEFGHALIFGKKVGKEYVANGRIIESVSTISVNHISKYSGSHICVFRHKGMTEDSFYLGREELIDNIGQPYPFHRLFVHGFDMANVAVCRFFTANKWMPKFRFAKVMPLDWPVCSELTAQFIIGARLETGLSCKGWRGVNPDHLDDARQNRADLYETVYYGMLAEQVIL
jgi:hypothetical protein